jgi:hypothetical protein
MEEYRRKFIKGIIWLAEHEPLKFHGDETLVERTVEYGSSAVPKVTKEEVEEVLDAQNRLV